VVQHRQDVDEEGRRTFLAGWSTYLSLLFCRFLVGASGHMHSFGYRPVRVNDFSATCGKVTWQSEGEHCASVGYPYSLVKEWVGSWAGWRWCADRIYQLQLWNRHVFIFCLCCDRINIVHLNVSKVICVGLARLEITSKQVLVLLFCNSKTPIQKSQQDAHVTEFILSDDSPTCFGYHYHPSSGAQNNCNYSIW
jgi:ribosomal protein L37E